MNRLFTSLAGVALAAMAAVNPAWGQTTSQTNTVTAATYTFVPRDCSTNGTKITLFNNAGSVAVTLPQAGLNGQFMSNCVLQIENIGAGTVTITPTTSTVNGGATQALGQFASTMIVSDATPAAVGNFWAFTGLSTSTATSTASITGTAATFPINGLAAAQGGSVTVTGGTSSTAANAGGAVALNGGVPGSTGNGGAATVTGANGLGGGAGGAATVTAGNGQGTGAGAIAGLVAGNSGAGATGNGGLARVLGGAALSVNGTGGATNVTSGLGTGTGNGGAAAILAGAGGATSGVGGQASLVAGGGGGSGNGGATIVTGGLGGATNTTGGALTMASGAGGGTGAGGIASMTGGTSGVGGATGNGGAANVVGGASVATNGTGGAATLTGGAGAGSGAGGAITIASGAGGSSAAGGAVNITASTGTGAAGAAVTITGSAGNGGTAAGGNVNLVPGAAVSTGIPGNVQVNANSNLIYATYYFTGTPAATNQVFFIATRPMILITCSEIHSVAAGGASTLTVEKLVGVTAPGSGTGEMTGSFNLNATANTVQAATLTGVVATQSFATGNALGVVFANAIQASAGVVVSCGFAPL